VTSLATAAVLPVGFVGRVDEPAVVRDRHLDWASLIRRVFDTDVRVCPACSGRVVVLAAISDPRVVERILGHLGLPTTLPACQPARAPPSDDVWFD
jgi:hypothetical protein